MRRTQLAVILSVMASGCAGVSPAQVGQTAGTIAGAAIVPGVGAPIGALAGLLAGMVVQKQVDKVTEKRERKELGDRMGAALSLLKEVERINNALVAESDLEKDR